ncbi:hypothetical protein GCM10011408_09330 [Dyella caseinilytica]|nr:hypothetical protein GCM10011408_09330 [Dyella caseinilytica]
MRLNNQRYQRKNGACCLDRARAAILAFSSMARHSGEDRNPCFVLTMDSGLRRSDEQKQSY